MENIPTINLEDYDHFRSKYIHKQTLKRNQDSYHIRQVDLCRHIDNSDDAIILKTIITPTSAPPGCFLFESQFCLKLKENPHPNLVKIIDIAQLPVPETDERKILITMEYCQNGSLFDELLNQKPIDIRKVLQDVYNALDSIWSRGFLHGDLNVCNILSDGSHYKLCDFGLTKPLDAFDTVGGVLGYLSLEARLSWTWRINFKNTRASELFSLGIILLQVFLDGVNPFHDSGFLETFQLLVSLFSDHRDPIFGSEPIPGEILGLLHPNPEYRVISGYNPQMHPFPDKLEDLDFVNFYDTEAYLPLSDDLEMRLEQIHKFVSEPAVLLKTDRPTVTVVARTTGCNFYFSIFLSGTTYQYKNWRTCCFVHDIKELLRLPCDQWKELRRTQSHLFRQITAGMPIYGQYKYMRKVRFDHLRNIDDKHRLNFFRYPPEYIFYDDIQKITGRCLKKYFQKET